MIGRHGAGARVHLATTGIAVRSWTPVNRCRVSALTLSVSTCLRRRSAATVHQARTVVSVRVVIHAPINLVDTEELASLSTSSSTVPTPGHLSVRLCRVYTYYCVACLILAVHSRFYVL